MGSPVGGIVFVGRSVIVGAGEDVGLEVGATVGLAVGLLVGAAVGAAVGLCVLAGAGPIHPPRIQLV